jgi:hypothetical protein
MHQWKKVQDPEKVFLSFLEGEEEGEMRVKEGITDKELRNLCYSYNLKEQIYSRSKYDHPYVVSSQENILQYFLPEREETYLFPSQEIAKQVKDSNNDWNYDRFSDDVYIGNGIYNKMIAALKSGETETCPAVFDRQDKGDFAMEFLRALRLAHKNNKPFSYDFGGNLNISLSSLTLPDFKDSTEIKKGGKLTDLEIITNIQNLSNINLNVYDFQEKQNYLTKNDKYLCFGKDGDEYALRIKTNSDCFDVLYEYIYGEVVKDPDNMITIRINRINQNQYRTVGELSIDNGAIRGYTLELPTGTDAECQETCTKTKKLQNECKRILRGTYDFEETVSSNNDKHINKSLRLHNVPGRSGILLHRGVNARIWSEGCILAMKNDPTNDADDANESARANQIQTDSEDFCVEIVNYVRKRIVEIKQKYGLQSIEMKIIITENSEINR